MQPNVVVTLLSGEQRTEYEPLRGTSSGMLNSILESIVPWEPDDRWTSRRVNSKYWNVLSCMKMKSYAWPNIGWVWGIENYPITRTVDNHIAKLRQKIEASPSDPEHIITVHRIGYKFASW